MPYRKKDGRLGVSTFNQNEKLEPWRDKVERAMREEAKKTNSVFNADDPIEVEYIFTFPAPKSKITKKRGHPIFKETPADLDKYIRAVDDAMTNALGVDDARIWHITAYKYYADDPALIGSMIQITQHMQEYSKERE